MGEVIYAVFPDHRKPRPIAEPALPETVVFPEHLLKPTSVTPADLGMPSDSGYPA